jgi:RNA polymerase sigma-70 factor (ECF subfamily)
LLVRLREGRQLPDHGWREDVTGSQASSDENGVSETERKIAEQIPRLRRYARALLGDPVRSDDLVQEALLRGLSRSHLWQPGTDIRAWMFTILHNIHVNNQRQRYARAEYQELVDDQPELATPARSPASSGDSGR